MTSPPFQTQASKSFSPIKNLDHDDDDAFNCKWKNKIRPKVSRFSEVYNSIQARHQSGACENTIYQET